MLLWFDIFNTFVLIVGEVYMRYIFVVCAKQHNFSNILLSPILEKYGPQSSAQYVYSAIENFGPGLARCIAVLLYF